MQQKIVEHKRSDEKVAKEREIPIKIHKLEALLRRISIDHPKRKDIMENIAKNKAGFKGEQATDFYLSFLSKEKYTILRDLRLTDGTNFFQLDILLLSSTYHLIIEVKNIAGTLLFDHHFSQIIRISSEKEEAFPNPILQVKRQKSQVRSMVKE